ncbi:Smr domain protein [Durotheca rogersii]|uniref:Smr domain protein n=1 Tax=Durotheca rogersii TaxID=419775 RepID=UPI00221EB08C|nr:Smr domain protein [Durotheca rogersii]KAI5863227.1 Smr domain protein [Durotheca rogersii]
MAIPLTRLGGEVFNHRPSLEAEAEYDRLRGLAREEAAKRNSCFDRAHQAYERGDGAEAKELSNQGKRHAAAMDEYNRQASEYIFRENNAPGRVDEDTIDLHGQFVEEAEEILERRIRYAQEHGQTHLHVSLGSPTPSPPPPPLLAAPMKNRSLTLARRRPPSHSIVGKGNHSANRVQKLKPRVEQVCRELGLKFATEDNAGRLYVNLQGGEAVPPPHGGHDRPSEGHHHPHQQPQPHRPSHHHHQPPPPEEDHRPDELERLVSRFVRKLGDCCVVM